MHRVLFVGLGGFVGSVVRYALAGFIQTRWETEFPVGTWSVNVIGSFLIGALLPLSMERGLIGADLRLFMAVGVLGGFTTMSTFSYETLALLRDGSWPLALSNVASTVGVCLLAVWLGSIVARLI